MKVLFAAGGTGGHLFPAIEIAKELSEENVDCFFAAHGLATSQMFPHDLYPWWDIPAERPSLSKLFSFGVSTASSTMKASKILSHLKPDCVIGFGSFHTFPILVATYLRRFPLFLFEPNVEPGRVIRLFSNYAQTTGVCFSEAKEKIGKRSTVVTMPLLQAHMGIVEKKTGLERYGLKEGIPVVAAFGGSQGSKVINERVIEALSLFEESKRPQLLVLCGLGQDKKLLEEKAKKLGVDAKVILFEREMAYVYAVADVVVCRSGASTAAELKHFKKPAVCIPYPHAKDNHQLLNAQALVKSSLAHMIQENELSPLHLKNKIESLLHRDFSKLVFSTNASTFSQVVLEYLR